MKKQTLSIFQFPKEIQREYHRLMNSKDDFLPRLSSADRRRLETSYAQLHECWHQNHTETLFNSLEQKYQELRKIQKSIEQDWTTYEKNTEAQLLIDMTKEERKLKERRQNLSAKKQHLERNKQTWAKDIRTKIKSLEEKISKLASSKKLLTESSAEKTKMQMELTKEVSGLSATLSSLSEVRKEKSNELTKNWKMHQENISQKRTSLLSGIEKLRNQKTERSVELKTKSKDYQESLKKKRSELQQSFNQKLNGFQGSLEQKKASLKENLKTYERTLIVQLCQEMASEVPTLPPEFESYWKQGEFSMILGRRLDYINDTKKHGDALKRELSKIGLNEEEFFRLMDKHDPD